MSGHLYSVEFFARCARRLKPGGVMCTWAPTARVEATFRRVFPHVLEVDAGGLVLVGSEAPLPLEPERWKANLRSMAACLGESRVEELAQRIEECHSASKPRGQDEEINEDLFPRDEFASP